MHAAAAGCKDELQELPAQEGSVGVAPALAAVVKADAVADIKEELVDASDGAIDHSCLVADPHLASSRARPECALCSLFKPGLQPARARPCSPCASLSVDPRLLPFGARPARYVRLLSLVLSTPLVSRANCVQHVRRSNIADTLVIDMGQKALRAHKAGTAAIYWQFVQLAGAERQHVPRSSRRTRGGV